MDLSDQIRRFQGMVDALETKNRNSLLEGGVADIIRQDVNEQFAQGGDPRWVPLAASTIKQKMSGGQPRAMRFGTTSALVSQRGEVSPANILISSGLLRKSWTEKGALFHVCKVFGDMLVIGSAENYANYHQSERPRKLNPKTGRPRLPRRPIVLRTQAMQKIRALLLRYVLSGGRDKT